MNKDRQALFKDFMETRTLKAIKSQEEIIGTHMTRDYEEIKFGVLKQSSYCAVVDNIMESIDEYMELFPYEDDEVRNTAADFNAKIADDLGDENHRLRELVKEAYNEGFEDGFDHCNIPQKWPDQKEAWEHSEAKKELEK